MKTFSRKKPASEAGDAEALTREQLWNRLLAWQTRRDHSRVELQQKLLALGADASACEALLQRLAELGLQNDDRYAGALVRSQLSRGRGPQALRQTLRQKGLATDHPALEAQTAELDWAAQAEQLIRRRLGARALSDPREQARQLRFLQYRGFSTGHAVQAIRAILADSGHPDTPVFDP